MKAKSQQERKEWSLQQDSQCPVKSESDITLQHDIIKKKTVSSFAVKSESD